MKSESVRAFIAVAVPQPLIGRLIDVQRRLQTQLGADFVRWCKPDQLHLTLKFLGDVPANRLDDLKAGLQRACTGQGPIHLALEHLGCFPNARNPRVVWVGLVGDQEKLNSLHQTIDAQTRGFGDHIEERAFHPHLTLGRVNADPRRSKQVGDAIEQVAIGRLGEWAVSEVELVQSELLPNGARYTRLATAALAE